MGERIVHDVGMIARTEYKKCMQGSDIVYGDTKCKFCSRTYEHHTRWKATSNLTVNREKRYKRQLRQWQGNTIEQQSQFKVFDNYQIKMGSLSRKVSSQQLRPFGKTQWQKGLSRGPQLSRDDSTSSIGYTLHMSSNVEHIQSLQLIKVL